jgi:hypothetical protein
LPTTLVGDNLAVLQGQAVVVVQLFDGANVNHIVYFLSFLCLYYNTDWLACQVLFIKKIEDFLVLHILTISKVSAGGCGSATAEVRAGIVATLSATACIKKLGERSVVIDITRAVRTETHTHRAVAVKSSIHSFYFLSFVRYKVGSVLSVVGDFRALLMDSF